MRTRNGTEGMTERGIDEININKSHHRTNGNSRSTVVKAGIWELIVM